MARPSNRSQRKETVSPQIAAERRAQDRLGKQSRGQQALAGGTALDSATISSTGSEQPAGKGS
jgi:hypothetical protein